MNNRKPLCREFQRGSCRFGNRCKFAHNYFEENKQPSTQPQRSGNGNYYGSLFSQATQVSQASAEHRCNDPKACKEQIKDDFKERPMFWPLTCYAHWKYLPNDIVGDMSFEELRSIAYEGAKQGIPFPDLIQREKNMFMAKNSEFEMLLRNPYKGPAAHPPQGTTMLFGKIVPSANQSAFQSSGPTGIMGSSSPFPMSHNSVPTVTLFGGMQSSGKIAPSNPFPPSQNPVPAVQSSAFSGGFQPYSKLEAPPLFQNLSALQQSSGFSGFETRDNMQPKVPITDSFSSFGGLPITGVMGQSVNKTDIQTVPGMQSGAGMQSPLGLPSQNNIQAGSEKDDIWFKEFWPAGQIPEDDDPPVYARY